MKLKFFHLLSDYLLLVSTFQCKLKMAMETMVNKGGIEKKIKRSPLFLFKKRITNQ